MSSSFESAFQFGPTAGARKKQPDEPMRILVVGNFSGHRESVLGSSVAGRKIRRVDIDNFDELIETMNPVARVAIGKDTAIDVPISEMDDFHPDELYRKLPLFADLRGLRKRLKDPATFDQAAQQLRDAVPAGEAPSEPGSSDVVDAPAEDDDQTLQRLLGSGAAVDASSRPPAGGGIQNLIDSIVAPYIIPDADPRQAEYLAGLDSAVAGQMRNILHDSSFQTLESLWRGLELLVRDATGNEDVQVFLWDVTETELLEATEGEQLETTIAYRRLVSERDQAPWSVIVNMFQSGTELNQLLLLTRLAALAAQSSACCLGQADPSMLGLRSWTDEIDPKNLGEESGSRWENWQAIRKSPIAPFIGLSGPRVLLRLPYGAATDEIDSFPFEEISHPIEDHDRLLWGASSWLAAGLLARSYAERQWSMQPGDQLQWDDLPMLVYTEDGEKHLKACGEAYLPERTAEAVLGTGIMPLVSFKNRNAVRILRIQSVASAASSLQGPWSEIV